MKITTTTNLLITLGIISAIVPIIGLIASACFLIAAFICAIVCVNQSQPAAVRLLISSIIAGPLAIAINLGITALSIGAGV